MVRSCGVLLIGLLLCAFSTSWGQSDWIAIVEERVAELEQRSAVRDRAWALEKYHLARACTLHDARAALQHIEQALEAAEQLGDHNLVQAGICVKSMISTPGLDNCRALFQSVDFHSPISAEEQLWWDWANAYYVCGDSAREQLEQLMASANECEDPILRAGAWIGIGRQFVRQREGLTEIIQNARAAVEASPMESLAVEVDLLEFIDAVLQGKRSRAPFDELGEISERAMATGNRYVYISAVSMRSAIGSLHETESVNLRADLQQAVDMAMESRVSHSLDQGVVAAIRYGLISGDTKFAANIADKVIECLPIADVSAFNIVPHALNAYVQDGQIDTARKLLERDLRRKEVEIAELQNRYEGVASELKSESALRRQFESERDQANTRYSTLGIVASIIGLGLLAFVFYSFAKLQNVHKRLIAETEASARVRAEQEQLKSRVSRLQRMESLGALAGGVAHDFNNLLVGVLCNAELIKNESLDDVERATCVDEIIGSAESAAELSKMMLAYTGKHPSRTEVIQLSEMLKDVMPLVRAASLKHEVKVQINDESACALADPAQIEQALLNLVRNSAKSLDGTVGCITISIGSVSLDQVDENQFHGSRREGGDFVYIEVADNGRGIEEERLERIFEPFFTEDEIAHRGRGLGLALVYGNVERHDGLIQCQSKVGQGTMMRILLPAANDRRQSKRSEPAVARTHKTGYAIVIDDEASVRCALKRTLELHGWQCETFGNPQEALSRIDNNAGKVDCIVVDVRMPEMDGSAICEHLQSHHAEVPVTVISGYSTTNLADFRRFSNVVNTLEKPFTSARILGSLEQALDQAPNLRRITR